MESSVRILAVDDSPGVLEAITGMVDGQFELQKASSLAAAMDCAERVGYSIVLMGLALPDGEGSALCGKLRKLYAMRPLQIIAMSGSADHARVQKALSAGADDFIKKPFEELEFKLRVKAALMRLAEQKKLISEREFYRQAVHQEETLSAKLLDRQMNLKEDLAAMTEKSVRALTATTRSSPPLRAMTCSQASFPGRASPRA
jgi:two-component system, sensor histidine kinase and response regulator